MSKYRVKPGSRVAFDDHDAGETGSFDSTDGGKSEAKAATAQLIARLDDLQERLYANRSRSLLIVLQGMDTSGKDGTIRHVMSGVNPQGVRVVSFKAPTDVELAHDFLWRVHPHTPARGEITIFNRSHYEDVLVPRVHGSIDEAEVKRRFEQINAFEELLAANGTAIVKFFLHISRDEQRKRLEDRVVNKDKRWKFSEGDLEERQRWTEYMAAFEDLLGATSTDHAPWYIVPADHKWYRNMVVADRMAHALDEMKLGPPPAPKGIDFDKLKIV